MPATISRFFGVSAVVVAVCVGAVLLLLPSGGGPIGGERIAGPDPPTGSGDATAAVGRAAWVTAENAKPGTADWHITGPASRNDIEGYTDVTSANQGQIVRLHVSTGAPTFRVEAYRIGWYGGTQGRLVWRSPTMPGVRQAPAVVDRLTNMAEARWQPSVDLAPDRSWPPGNYLLKLVASNGFAQFVPLTIRDDASRAALVVVNAVTTWQAYNRWGGASLYEGIARSGGSAAAGRATVVSFDRPYENDSGAGDYLGNELPMVSFLEKYGYDVTYVTDIELHQRPDLLAKHKAILSLGHDEYWTREMRDNVEQARDRGINVAFFGANAVYRAIRLVPSPLGPFRRQINYRSAAADPVTGLDDSRVTVSWREPPLNRPESSLVGTYYECNPVNADLVVFDPSAWVFAGTGLAAGDRLVNLVGPEYDRYTPEAPAPPGPVQVLAHSPLRCGGRASYSDMTYYSTPSGAGVFATGTNWWISRLGPPCPPDVCYDEKVDRITWNVLDAFAAGPAGLTHQSVANLGSGSRASGGSTGVTPTTRSGPAQAPRTTTAVPPPTVATRPPAPRPPATRPPATRPRSTLGIPGFIQPAAPGAND